MRILLRLSDYRATVVEFSATDHITLKQNCHRAWRQFGALIAQRPGYFEATTEYNKYRAHLTAALTDDARAVRVARWAAAGKPTAEIERLWKNFQRDSHARLEHARRRLQDRIMPDSLSLQVAPLLHTSGPWLNPGNSVNAVWWSPPAPTNWPQLWADVEKVHNRDKKMSALCDWVGAFFDQVTPESRRREFRVLDGQTPEVPA